MTRSCCPSCRLRFTNAAAAVLVACPACGDDLHQVGDIVELVGYRLSTDSPEAQIMAAAVAVSLRNPLDVTP